MPTQKVSLAPALWLKDRFWLSIMLSPEGGTRNAPSHLIVRGFLNNLGICMHTSQTAMKKQSAWRSDPFEGSTCRVVRARPDIRSWGRLLIVLMKMWISSNSSSTAPHSQPRPLLNPARSQHTNHTHGLSYSVAVWLEWHSNLSPAICTHNQRIQFSLAFSSARRNVLFLQSHCTCQSPAQRPECNE